MYENEYMYAIERNGDYLAHYGVRGMKWGVRKAKQMGGERGARKLSRQYAKASKKLAKLEKQAGRTKKYARRAALMGAGAAAAGGAAALGTKGINQVMRGVGGAMQGVGRRAQLLAATPGKVDPKLGAAIARGSVALQSAGSGLKTAGMSVKQWGRSTSIGRGIQNSAGKVAGQLGKGKGAMMNIAARDSARNATAGIAKLNNNTIARIGAGAIGAGLAAGAARNAYKAATAKKRAAQFKTEMNKAFAGTQYANGGNRQGKKRRSNKRG